MKNPNTELGGVKRRPSLSFKRRRTEQAAIVPGQWKTGCWKWPLLAVLLFAVNVSAQNYVIDWSTIDGGGGASTGGVYSVTDSVGQPDAGRMSGGSYSVEGGFWGIIAAVQEPGSPPLRLIRNPPLSTLTLAWPYPSDGYGLQQSTNLNTVNWVAATNEPVQVGDEWQVTVTPPTEGSLDESYCQYFRLKK